MDAKALLLLIIAGILGAIGLATSFCSEQTRRRWLYRMLDAVSRICFLAAVALGLTGGIMII